MSESEEVKQLTEPENKELDTEGTNVSQAASSMPIEEISEDSKPTKKRKKAAKKGIKKITKPAESKVVLATRGWFTTILIWCNIIFFVVMIKQFGMSALWLPKTDALLKMGADYGPYVANGEKWRIFTSMFIHVGIIHLAVNMSALASVGKLLERLYGSQKFLIIYFLSGTVGSLISLLWNPTVVSAGASAAVFGVIGAEFVYVWIHRRHFTAAAIHAHYGAFATLLAYSLIAAYLSFPVDHAAHIGGFVCGILAGFALIPRVMTNIRWQLEDIPRLALLLLGLAGLSQLTEQHLANIPFDKITHSQNQNHKSYSQAKHHGSRHSDSEGSTTEDQSK